MKNRKRIDELVTQLQLIPHPEGGFYKETYRSEKELSDIDRSLTTSIYFLLTGENFSRLHRIQSDELWFFHEGDNLIVHELDHRGYTTTSLGINLSNGEKPFHLVKAGSIFGSTVSTVTGYALVSCVVAPGFDFRDFELFSKAELLPLFPDYEEIIERLTR